MVKYTILQGDTVHSIAQNVLGNSEYWLDIVESNNLDYPFITDKKDEIEVGKNIKTIGDEIDIPAKSDEGVIRYIDAEDEIFGTDLLLSNEKFIGSYREPGGLSVDGHGDVSTITGEDCLMQDLIHSLVTPVGSLVLHPKYGSRFMEFIGQKNLPDNLQRASLELQKTFLSDPRVIDVRDVTMEVFEDGVYMECWINTTAQEIKWKHVF